MYLKNDPSYEFIGEEILKINIVYAEKIKAEVYVNFLLYFPHELLMSFLISDKALLLVF
jgi:hypothetical protein